MSRAFCAPASVYKAPGFVIQWLCGIVCVSANSKSAAGHEVLKSCRPIRSFYEERIIIRPKVVYEVMAFCVKLSRF